MHRALCSLLTVAMTATLVGGGCAPKYRRHPVPPDLVFEAHVPGQEFHRILGPERVMKGFEDRRAEFIAQARSSDHFQQPPTLLSISGGGSQGAFGAGLLVGWTERGDRPEFTYVTGISTGALIAPFAFLGPDYDDELEEVYTTVRTKDLVKRRGLLTAITSDAFTSTKGLRRLIATFVDEQMMDDIAREHRRGRRLYVGTTNLDLMMPVYWSIGHIADSGDPGSLELIRDLLLASASIPGAFPPVYIKVEAGGEIYDEMHVDGGAAAQVFAYPGTFDWDEEMAEAGFSTAGVRLFVIRNSFLKPEYEQVEPKLFSIVGRSISSLIRTQGIGDIFQIYLIAERDGIEFNATFIGDDFEEESTEPFDPVYMTKLFEYGKARIHSDQAWMKQPPAFIED